MPDGAVSAQQIDQNGYVTIERNPITRVGVFPYSGRSLPGADPDRIYMVYRPEEEVCSPETLNSLKLLPIIDEHTMLGSGFTPVENITTHGTSGEEVVAENGVVYSVIRIFSSALKSLIDAGKKGLSVGYRCAYEKASGIWNGQHYDYVQRNIRGNHIALVHEGRMGKDIAVLDQWAFDSFDLDLNPYQNKRKESPNMAEEMKNDAVTEKKDGGKDEAIGLEQVHAWAKANMGMFNELKSMMSAEAGEGADAEEKKDDDKAAKDAAEAEEKKKAEDAAACAKQAMDGVSDIRKELASIRAAADPKAIRAEMRRADDLAKQLSPLVGTFDHTDMSAHDVAVYGCEKLGLKPAKGQEESVLGGYLSGAKAAASKIGFAQDGGAHFIQKPNAGGKLAATLAKHA